MSNENNEQQNDKSELEELRDKINAEIEEAHDARCRLATIQIEAEETADYLDDAEKSLRELREDLDDLEEKMKKPEGDDIG